MTLESRIEGKAVKEMAVLGCVAAKWGTDGWPDRIVFMPNGAILLMEFKQPHTGRVSILQKLRHKQLKDRGIHVHIVTSVAQAVGLVRGSSPDNRGGAAAATLLHLGEAGLGKDRDSPDGD